MFILICKYHACLRPYHPAPWPTSEQVLWDQMKFCSQECEWKAQKYWANFSDNLKARDALQADEARK